MLKRIFTGLYRFLWYTFAIITINAAVIVTAVRFALPEIGGYKTEIQAWVSEYMEYPVTIDEISAEWQGWAPNLYLNKIDLYTQDNGILISTFDSAHIGIDLFASLKEGEIIPTHLSVSGLDLEFNRNVDGTISISSNDQNRLSANGTGNNTAFSDWLFKQKRIVLNKSKLSWQDVNNREHDITLSDVTLELRTHEDRVQFNAYVALPEEFGKSLNVNADIYGNILDTEWRGEIYIDAKQVDPNKFIKDFPVNTSEGHTNLKLWTNWEQAKLKLVNASLEYQDFSLNIAEHSLPVNLAQLNLHAERKKEKDWYINIDLEKFNANNIDWPQSEYQLLVERDIANDRTTYSANLPYINIHQALPFLIKSNLLPNNIRERLDADNIDGELKDINMTVATQAKTIQSLTLNTAFNKLRISDVEGNHTVDGINGELAFNNESIKLKLDSKNTNLKIGSLYERSFYLPLLEAEVEYLFAQTPILRIDNMAFTVNDIPVKTSGLLRFDESSPFVDLIFDIDQTNIESLPVLLPKQATPRFKKWLNNAFAGGQLASGDVIFRGHLADYPFKNAEGNFKAVLSIVDATFEYSEGWPPLDKTDIEVVLDNEQLNVSTNSGYLFDARLESASASIDDITKEQSKHVLFEGNLSGHTSDAKNFIEQSPLSKNEDLVDFKNKIAGNINLKLKLDIPLDEKKTVIDGLMSFTDATLESELPGLGLEDINGDISFNRHQVWASDVDALYFGKPVKVNIPKRNNPEQESEKFIVSGLADKRFIIDQLNSFFPSLNNVSNRLNEYFDGKSKWYVTIGSEKDESNTESKSIEISSELEGMAIALPAPLGKEKNDRHRLSIITSMSESAMEKIAITYNDSIFTDILLDNRQDIMVKKILVGLGQQQRFNQNKDGIYFSGELDELDLSEWIEFINLKTPNKSAPISKNKKDISFDLFVKELRMLDNSFSNVDMELTRLQGDWEITLDSTDIKGTARLLKDRPNTNDQLVVRLEHIALQGSDEEKTNSSIAIKKLPELDVTIEQTFYKDNDLGKTTLLTKNIAEGITIETLDFSKPGFSITAKGQWTRIDDIDRSDFSAELNSDSISDMLKTFNYEGANIDGGETSIRLTAGWMDTPMNFSLEKINGKLEMDIGKGQFLDIEPSAGRLFGLLSLQTLPRRLLLDFTDLFKKGFAFDNIEGDFSLQQGHAYTNDLQMTGPAADIMVSGRTGIITEDYDQIATVTPKLSNSLPVASALLGPVGVGVGAVIFLAGELFESIPKQINKVLSYQYSITGSWDNPNIEKLKDKQSG